MPETSATCRLSLMRMLRNPQAADRIVESVLTYARVPRITDSRTPVAGIFPTAELKTALGKFFRELRSEKAEFAENVERRYLSIAQKPLGEILPGLPESLAAGLASSLSSIPEADDARPRPGSMLLSDALGDFVLSYAKRLEGKTIGEVLAWVIKRRRRSPASSPAVLPRPCLLRPNVLSRPWIFSPWSWRRSTVSTWRMWSE